MEPKTINKDITIEGQRYSIRATLGDNLAISATHAFTKAKYATNLLPADVDELTKGRININSEALFELLEAGLASNDPNIGLECIFYNNCIELNIKWNLTIGVKNRISKNIIIKLSEAQTSLDERITAIISDLNNLQGEVDANTANYESIIAQLGQLEAKVTPVDKQLDLIEEKIKKMQQWVELIPKLSLHIHGGEQHKKLMKENPLL
jgi:hypothetical protein